MTAFRLHPQLQQDTILVGRFPLSLLLLHKDANYPWFILVPQRAELTEVYQLDQVDRVQLLAESCQLSESLNRVFGADKLNLATIGNMVPQLHYHHVVRYRDDPAWPAPIWGAVPAIKYAADELDERLRLVREGLLGTAFEAS